MTNEIQVRERIAQVMEIKGINPRTLSGDDVNLYQKAYLQIARGKTLTSATIGALLNAVPDLSTEWLFRGIGEPFVAEQPAEQVPTDTPQWAREMETRLLTALSQSKKTEISHADDTAQNLSVKVSLD